MIPLAAAASLGSSALNAGVSLYGASQERKMRRRAAELAQKGVGELQGGTGYNYANALKALGLTDQSAYSSMDPVARQASMQALQNLVQRGSGSGLDIQSRQALAEATSRSGAAQNAARQAVMQEYLQRSSGGSGAELAAMLGGQQASYGQLAGATGQAAAAAEQRRLEANVLASRAGQQQQQLEQQKAAALDALKRFNVGARQSALDLERQYRGGAADVYGRAGAIMGGQAGGVGRTYDQTGAALSSLGNAALGAYNQWSAPPASSYGNYVQQTQDPYSYNLSQGGSNRGPADYVSQGSQNERYNWNPTGGAW